MKTCSKCTVRLPDSSFKTRQLRGRTVLRECCIDCTREKGRAASRAWYAKPENKIRARDCKLRRDYGISLMEWQEMHARQGGLCDICGRPMIGDIGCNVDHDHLTGQVRALLCNGCNGGLGYFQDDPTVLEAARVYLARWGKI